MPVFSLVIPTIHRTQELSRLLESLKGQKGLSFGFDEIEVVIVDQNQDERLRSVIEPYLSFFKVVHLKAPSLGQSHAKNVGMKFMSGKYAGFPDDDCYYRPDTLSKVYETFLRNEGEVAIFGKVKDPEVEKDLLRYPQKSFWIAGVKNSDAFWGIQSAQFFRAEDVRQVGDFDVDLCSGGKWGSGEETDFALRFLRRGGKILYLPEIVVHHPWVVPETMELKKAQRYAMGFGALCRKQGLAGLLLLKALKQFLGSVFFLFAFRPHRAFLCWNIGLFRLKGYWLYGLSGWKGKDRAV